MTLREELAFLKQLLDTLPFSIYWKDTNATYLGCNKLQAEKWRVVSPEAIKGKTDSDLFFRRKANTIRTTDRRLIQDKVPQVSEEVSRVGRQDEQRYISYKLPLIDAQGNVCGIVSFARNITDDIARIKQHGIHNKFYYQKKINYDLGNLIEKFERLVRPD